MCTMLRPAFTSMVPQLQVIAKRPSDAIRRHQVLPAGGRIAFIVWRAISSGILWWSFSTRAPFLSVLAMRIFCNASCPMSRALTNGRFGTHAFALMQNRHKHKRGQLTTAQTPLPQAHLRRRNRHLSMLSSM